MVVSLTIHNDFHNVNMHWDRDIFYIHLASPVKWMLSSKPAVFGKDVTLTCSLSEEPNKHIIGAKE